MLTAPSDLTDDCKPARLPRRRATAVLGSVALGMSFTLGAHAQVAQAQAEPVGLVTEAPPAYAEADYDRPSSDAVDAPLVTALADRTVVRASRDFDRMASEAPAAAAPAATKPAAAATPLSVVRPASAGNKPKPSTGSKWKAARWVRPANGYFTSGYKRRWGRMHRGIDLAGPTGTPIYAASDGVVTSAGAASGYGRLVTIRHAGGIVTAYGHMSRIKVSVGERVKAGEIIALVGSAGRSTGPHLHFEVRMGGGTVNPQTFLAKRGVRV